MSVADQINRIKTNIANAYSAAEAKGATIPEVKNSENLSACVDSITTGGGGDTQFGLTAEQMLGTPNSEGNLTLPTLPSITFTGVKNIPAYAFYYKFVRRHFEDGASVSFPDLTTVNSNGMSSAFQGCSSLTSVDLSNLTTVDTNGMLSVFLYCNSLTSADLSNLTTVGLSGMSSAFGLCRSLTTISFPSLTSVQTNSFGVGQTVYCFYECKALTEIHFRADAQATIEAMTGYADKWGASSSTIYFDL